MSSSTALANQPEEGKAQGFDFARDPFNAKRPMQPAEEIMKADIAEKPKVTAAQRKLLEQRYDLTPRLDAAVKMSRDWIFPRLQSSMLSGVLIPPKQPQRKSEAKRFSSEKRNALHATSRRFT